ncbi:MAG TPA: copper chaperone PCu(A)C [Sphingomonadales bacterium]
MPARLPSRLAPCARFMAALMFILGCAAVPAAAEESADGARTGAITVSEPWIRAPLLPGRPAAAYFVIENGGAADRLLEVRTEAAGRVEIHSHVEENGVMKMRRQPALEVPAEAKAVLEPRGDHIMLFDPAPSLKAGAEVELTLVFEQAGEIAVMAPVYSLRAEPAHDHQ